MNNAVYVRENSSEYISRISAEYGLYVLDRRAIPMMTDGLKVSQRIALWLAKNKKDKIKTISLAGEMISSNLYVHGDTSAADAISMLAAPYLNNNCLLDGIGAFGTRTSPSGGIGQPRYTYVKRSAFADKALYSDLDIIPMVENYDGSAKMPFTFLPMIPLVLLNGVKGVAIGWSTNILPRSLDDLKKAVGEVLKYGKVKTKLMPYFENYDVDIEIDPDNSSRYFIKGKFERKNTSTIVVTELPPDISLEKYREKLADLENAKRITGWTDGSTKHIEIEIKIPRATLSAMSDDELIEFLKIRSTITERIVVISTKANGVKQYETAEELIVDWVNWRLDWYLTRYEYLLKKEEEKSLYYLTLLACFEGTKKLKPMPQKVMTIKNKSDLVEYIQQLTKASGTPVVDEIIEKAANLPVYKWTEEGYNEVVEGLKTCDANITEYESIIDSPSARRKIFEDEIKALK